MKKVLINGGLGFIGQHVARFFAGNGWDVYIHDVKIRTSTEYDMRSTGMLVNVGHIEINERIQDLNRKFDLIINLAALAGVRGFATSEYYSYNCVDLIDFLDVIKGSNLTTPIIHAGSSSVYGNFLSNDENCSRNADRLSLYASSKMAAEDILSVYSSLHKMNITVLRFFNVYGEFPRPDGMFYKFIASMMGDKKIIVFGGDQRRSFTYVADVVHAINFVYCSAITGFHVFNIGNTESIGLCNIIRLIEEHFGEKFEIITKERRQVDVLESKCDNTRFDNYIKSFPKTKIEDGMRILCDWAKKNKEYMEMF